MSNKLIAKVIKRGNHKFVDVDEWEAELEISIQIVDKCRAQLMSSTQLKIMFSAQVLFFLFYLQLTRPRERKFYSSDIEICICLARDLRKHFNWT